MKAEKHYVYFFCDPTKPCSSVGDYTLNFEPYYCGKGTLKRSQSLKRSKPINDKTKSLIEKGVQPVVTRLGPFDEETSFLIEDYFVTYFKRRDLFEDGVLLNLQNGGVGGKCPSLESRLKMSESHLGHIPWNKGKKGVQVAWNKGKSNHFAKGTKFFNNGVEQKMFIPGNEPEGWILGRLNEFWNKNVIMDKRTTPRKDKGEKRGPQKNPRPKCYKRGPYGKQKNPRKSKEKVNETDN